MSWTMVAQVAILSLFAAMLVILVGSALRTPDRGLPGDQGPKGDTGSAGPPCQGPCCAQEPR